MDGIKYSLIWQILLEEHMAVTILKPFECPFTQIAEFEEFISATDYMQKTSYPRNSNFMFRKNKKRQWKGPKRSNKRFLKRKLRKRNIKNRNRKVKAKQRSLSQIFKYFIITILLLL